MTNLTIEQLSEVSGGVVPRLPRVDGTTRAGRRNIRREIQSRRALLRDTRTQLTGRQRRQVRGQIRTLRTVLRNPGTAGRGSSVLNGVVNV